MMKTETRVRKDVDHRTKFGTMAAAGVLEVPAGLSEGIGQGDQRISVRPLSREPYKERKAR